MGTSYWFPNVQLEHNQPGCDVISSFKLWPQRKMDHERLSRIQCLYIGHILLSKYYQKGELLPVFKETLLISLAPPTVVGCNASVLKTNEPCTCAAIHMDVVMLKRPQRLWGSFRSVFFKMSKTSLVLLWCSYHLSQNNSQTITPCFYLKQRKDERLPSYRSFKWQRKLRLFVVMKSSGLRLPQMKWKQKEH